MLFTTNVTNVVTNVNNTEMSFEKRNPQTRKAQTIDGPRKII